MSISRYRHIVVLPSALKVIPSRAHKVEFSGLAIDNVLKLKLKSVISIPLEPNSSIFDLPLALWKCHRLGFLHSSSYAHGVI